MINKTLIVMLAVVFFLPVELLAQLSEPNTEEVYGGFIKTITSYSVANDTSRVYITTESANSAFYCDVTDNGTSISYSGFNVMPAMDAAANLGGSIEDIAVHESGAFFFVNNGDLYQTHADSTMAMHLSAYVGLNSILIRDSVMLFTAGNELYFGALDVSGNFTEDITSPLTISLGGNLDILIAPMSKLVYLFSEGTASSLIKLSDSYYSLSSSTTESDISPMTLNNLVQWRSCGIAPDGRVFIGGSDFNNLYFAHSDDEVSWVETNTGIQGSGGSNFSFSDTSSNYGVYNGKLYNSDRGDVAWTGFGSTSFETHPNDGAVHCDLSTGIVFMTTDMGLGVSEDGGANIFEVNDGIEAVHVNGIDMTDSKATAWVASKSGVRQVQNYTTSPIWSNAIYPNGDGSPYWSVAINPDDSMNIYVGNLRLYKSNDGGANWVRVFSAEDPPYNYPSFGSVADITTVSAIAVCPLDTNIVMIGYNREDSLGGLFVSEDGGLSWNQILLEASVDGQDLNVRDIAFYSDGMDTIAYVGVRYDQTFMQGRSVYKVVKTSGGWVGTQDMDAANTSVGYQITATIRDLDISDSVIYATGTDAGINHPISYYRDLGDSAALWQAFTTSGFPYVQGKKGRAITVGNDTIYCAVDNEIYYYDPGAPSAGWQLGYAYPSATRINFLFFDDLLVGTGTGLYGHFGLGVVTKIDKSGWEDQKEHIKLYPNPVGDILTLESDRRLNLNIFDITGKLLISYQLEQGRSTIDLSRLLAGKYIIQLESEKSLWSEQLILIR